MTIVAPGIEPFAFDSGPANSLLDYAAAKLSGGKLTYDKDGAWAAQGKVNEALLAEMMAHPYLKLQPPKSTGKEHFGPAFVEPILARDWTTRTAWQPSPHLRRTASRKHRDFAPYVREVFVSGGGAHNRTLMAMMEAATPDITWRRIDELGLPSDAKEAIAFALLGYQTLHGRPGLSRPVRARVTRRYWGTLRPATITGRCCRRWWGRWRRTLNICAIGQR